MILLSGLEERWDDLVVTKYKTATGRYCCDLDPKWIRIRQAVKKESQRSTEAKEMNAATNHLYTKCIAN